MVFSCFPKLVVLGNKIRWALLRQVLSPRRTFTLARKPRRTAPRHPGAGGQPRSCLHWTLAVCDARHRGVSVLVCAGCHNKTPQAERLAPADTGRSRFWSLDTGRAARPLFRATQLCGPRGGPAGCLPQGQGSHSRGLRPHARSTAHLLTPSPWALELPRGDLGDKR